MTELCLPYGPLNKSIQTQLFELIVKLILHCPHAIQLSHQKDKATQQTHTYIQVANQEIHLEQLIHNANLNHVELSELDSDTAVKLLKYKSILHDYNPKMPITTAEFAAIRSYTRDNYIIINAFLYSHTKTKDWLFINTDAWLMGNEYHDNGHDNNTDSLSSVIPILGGKANLKTIVEIAFLSSGLNKLYDVDAHHFVCYRGDSHLSVKQINALIAQIESGHCVTYEPGFKSTTDNNAIAHSFSSKVTIIFDDVYGNDIMPYSEFEYESEYLMLPGKWHWYDYQRANDGSHVFYVRFIEPLDDILTSSNSDITAQFATLVDYAMSEGLDLSFITPYNMSQIAPMIHHNPLELTEVIDMSPLSDLHEIGIVINSDVDNGDGNKIVSDRLNADGHGTVIDELFILDHPIMVEPMLSLVPDEAMMF